MDLPGEEWLRKGATLSDKTARSEFGLKQLRGQLTALQERRSILRRYLRLSGKGAGR
jgi:hypothetical protein